MLIKPASSLCNLRCKYCFYEDVSNNRCNKSFGIMQQATSEALIDEVLSTFTEEITITFAFQGGEPTVAGLDYFTHFTNYVSTHKKDFHHIQYAIQTNATLMDESWMPLLKKHHFLVGVSLDAFKENNDYFRINASNEGSFDKILKTIDLLRQYDIDFNILTVLTHQLAKYPTKVFEFYKQYHFDYVQLIPCLDEFDAHTGYALTPNDFFNFYDTFFDLWYKEYKNGHYMSVTLFDNLIPLFAGQPATQCGFMGFCSNQFIVESNGDVYPCDFYVLDQYCLGNISSKSIKELATSKIAANFIKEKKVLSNKCKTCKYWSVCKGQCKRLSGCYYTKNYCAYQEFIDKKYPKFLDIIQQLSNKSIH